MKQFIFLSKVLFVIIICMKACFANPSMICKDIVTNSGTISDDGGTANIHVSIDPVYSDTNVLIFDASKELQCHNQPTKLATELVEKVYTDSIVYGTGLTGVSGFSVIAGSNYPMPVKNSVHIFTLDTGTDMHQESAFIPVQLYIDLTDPTTDIPIHQGDLLYTLTVRDNYSILHTDMYYKWNIYAANDIIIVPSTCSINNDEVISVDFNTVQLTDIGTTSQNTNTKKNVDVSIQCDSSATQSVGAEFVASATGGFQSSNVVSTSMAGLGVTFSQNGGELPLNQEAVTHVPLASGTGSLNFDVNLVKQDDTTITSGGDFTASATIVLTAE